MFRKLKSRAISIILCCAVILTVIGCDKTAALSGTPDYFYAGQGSTVYLLQKTASCKMKVVLQFENKQYYGVRKLGVYPNKLYICDEIGLAYYDLRSAKPSRVEWIHLPKKGVGGPAINNAAFYNDTMYFSFGFDGGEENTSTSGLMALKLTATSMNQAQYSWIRTLPAGATIDRAICFSLVHSIMIL